MSIVIIPQRTGRRLNCNCGYQWVYAGKSEFFASCPHCRSTVTIQPKRKKIGGNAPGCQ
jgi:lipopolysaccharide biosynthesis regulator YciM